MENLSTPPFSTPEECDHEDRTLLCSRCYPCHECAEIRTDDLATDAVTIPDFPRRSRDYGA